MTSNGFRQFLTPYPLCLTMFTLKRPIFWSNFGFLPTLKLSIIYERSRGTKLKLIVIKRLTFLIFFILGG